MNESHVSREALEAYVIGALDEREAQRVEAHVLSCAACEARLQHEASLELAFTQVATRAVPERPRRISRLAAPAAAVGGVLAFAAAMVLWLTPRAEVDARAPGAAAEAQQTISEASGDASTATAQLDVPGDGAARAAFRD